MTFDHNKYMLNINVREMDENPFVAVMYKNLTFAGPTGPVQVTSLWTLKLEILDTMAQHLVVEIENYTPPTSFLDTAVPTPDTTISDNTLRLECLLQIIKYRQTKQAKLQREMAIKTELELREAYLDGQIIDEDSFTQFQEEGLSGVKDNIEQLTLELDSLQKT